MEKKLYLSSKDKKLAGVCGGFAKYFGIDSTLVRIGYIALILCGGTGILLYIICALVIPNEPM
ncbi:PspC domain-containing protein [Clostridium beijerinckii]|nr:PspC domain-containing protein [Clostridium beijerinckii]